MLNNMKVGTRLLAAFLLVVSLGAIVAGIGIVNMSKMNAQAELAYSNDLLGLSALKEANINLIYIGRAARGMLLASTPEERTRFDTQVESAKKDLHTELDTARPLFITATGKALFTEADRSVADYESMLAQLRKLAAVDTPEGKAEAIAFAFGPYGAKANYVDERLSELGLQKEKAAQAAAAESSRLYASSRILMIVMVLGTLALGVALGVWITRKLTRQLGGEPDYAVSVADAIARGELATVVATRQGDSTSLLHAMETMRAALVRIVGQVRSGTDTIATASSQIASGNMDLSSRTEEQASSLEETASSMEELTSTVKQNADNARQANVLAASASEVAQRGGSVVSEVVTTMASINESSRKIVDIIGVIDGIAFQTNILALNAAVEAARAGEQGRGFAVVASEVRNLAQRSAAAAKEIKTLINDSVEKVDAGGRLVDQAGVTMTEIVESITRVTDIMSEIASASMEQTMGIEQINTAIAQMDEVTQQNAALVEEAAAAAGSLQDQAATLADVVSIFKLGDDGVLRQHAPRKAHARPAMAARSAPPAHATPAPAVAAALATTAAPARLAQAKAEARAKAAAPVTASDSEWEEF